MPKKRKSAQAGLLDALQYALLCITGGEMTIGKRAPPLTRCRHPPPGPRPLLAPPQRCLHRQPARTLSQNVQCGWGNAQSLVLCCACIGLPAATF